MAFAVLPLHGGLDQLQGRAVLVDGILLATVGNVQVSQLDARGGVVWIAGDDLLAQRQRLAGVADLLQHLAELLSRQLAIGGDGQHLA